MKKQLKKIKSHVFDLEVASYTVRDVESTLRLLVDTCDEEVFQNAIGLMANNLGDAYDKLNGIFAAIMDEFRIIDGEDPAAPEDPDLSLFDNCPGFKAFLVQQEKETAQTTSN